MGGRCLGASLRVISGWIRYDSHRHTVISHQKQVWAKQLEAIRLSNIVLLQDGVWKEFATNHVSLCNIDAHLFLLQLTVLPLVTGFESGRWTKLNIEMSSKPHLPCLCFCMWSEPDKRDCSCWIHKCEDHFTKC